MSKYKVISFDSDTDDSDDEIQVESIFNKESDKLKAANARLSNTETPPTSQRRKSRIRFNEIPKIIEGKISEESKSTKNN